MVDKTNNKEIGKDIKDGYVDILRDGSNVNDSSSNNESLNNDEYINNLNRVRNALYELDYDISRMRTDIVPYTQEVIVDVEFQQLDELNQRLVALLPVDQNIFVDAEYEVVEDITEEIEVLESKLSKTADNAKYFGDSMSSVGEKMNAFTAPIKKIGEYAIQSAMEFEQSMAHVKSASGATEKEIEKLSDKAKDMGLNTSFSAMEASKAFSHMASSGWKTKDMLDGLDGVMNLVSASGEDLAVVSDIMTESIDGFGVSADNSSKFADILATATSNTNTSLSSLGEAFKYVAPTMGEVGYSAKDTAVALGLMASAGVEGSKSGESLNKSITNMLNPTSDMKAIMNQYNLSLTNTDGSMKTLSEVMEMLRGNMGGLDEATKKSATSTLFGADAMDGMLSIINASESEYLNLSKAINNCDGTAAKMADTMNNTAQGQVAKLKSQMESLGIQIGENLLPHINSFVGKLSELVEWFGNLDEGTQKAIIGFGMFATVGGSVLSSVGSISNGIGSLIGVMGKTTPAISNVTEATQALGEGASVTAGSRGFGSLISSFKLFSPVGLAVTGGIVAVGGAIAVANTHAENMSKTITTASEDLSWFEKVVASFTGTQFESREELEKSGKVYKELSSTLSEDFVSAIERSTTKTQEFSMFLSELSFGNAIDENEHSEFVTRVSEMCDGATTAVKVKQEETQTAMKGLFNADAIMSEEEIKTVEALNRISNETLGEIDSRKARILEIEQASFNENRSLEESERAEIENHQQAIRQIQLEALGGSQEEILYAKNEFSNRLSKLSSQEASNLLQQKNEEIEEQRIQIQSSYDTQIGMLEEKMGKMTDAEKANAEITLEQLKSDKEARLSEQDELWNSYIDIVNEKNPALLETLNMYNGEELTQDDLKSQKQLEKLKSKYDGMNEITESGTYQMLNTQTGLNETMEVLVDEATGNVIGAYSYQSNKVSGYSEEMANSVRATAAQNRLSSDEMVKAFSEAASASINNSGQVVDSNGNVIASLSELETAADGAKTGFINLNGEKVEIKSNANGTITDFSEVQKKIQAIDKNVKISIHTSYTASGIPPNRSMSSAPGRSIEAPQGKFSLPKTYEYMIVEPTFYSSENNSISNISRRGDEIYSSKESSIDYSSLANIIAQAVSDAISNVRIEPIIEATIDGTALYSKVSNNLAMGIRGRR